MIARPNMRFVVALLAGLLALASCGEDDEPRVEQDAPVDRSADTDGDGYTDGLEFDQGTDYNDPDDFPDPAGFDKDAGAASTPPPEDAPPASDLPPSAEPLPDPKPVIASSQTCHDRNTAGGNSDQDVEVTGLRDGDTVTLTYLDEAGQRRESTKAVAKDGRAVVSVPLQTPGETLTLDGVIVDAPGGGSQFGFGASAVSGEQSFVVTPLAESNCSLLDSIDPSTAN